jgi:hypothetical protein
MARNLFLNPRPAQNPAANTPRRRGRNLFGESIEEEEPEEGPIFPAPTSFRGALDLLNTPQQLIFGGVDAALKGEPILAGAAQGARQDILGRDVLETAGVGKLGSVDLPILGEVTGRGTLGLGLDIAADPLLGIGKLGKAVGIGEQFSKLGRIIPHQVGGTLGLSADLAVFRDITKAAESAQRGGKGALSIIGELQNLRLGKLSKQTGETVPELGRRATALAEKKFIQRARIKTSLEKKFGRGSVPDTIIDEAIYTSGTIERRTGLFGKRFEVIPGLGVSKQQHALAEIASQEKNFFGDTLLRERVKGVDTPGMDTTSLEHVTHLLTKDAKDIIMKNPEAAAFAKKYTGVHGFQLSRKWQGMSIDRINELAAKGKLPGLEKPVIRNGKPVLKPNGKPQMEGVKIPQIFETDPVVIQMARGSASNRAIRDVEVFQEVATKLGKKIEAGETIPANMRELSITRSADPRTKALGESLKGTFFTDEVANHVDAYYNLIDGQINPFIQKLDRVQANWKALTLFIFPSYHTRNAVGNVFNNFLAGLRDPTYYARAAKFQNTPLDSATEVFNVAGRKLNTADFAEELANFGITNQFAALIDLPGSGVKDLFVGQVPFLGAGLDKGLKAGNLIENNARIAHFMWRLDKGDTALDAAISVKRHLFDYADLTVWEKTYMRRAAPFYAWTRFNLPLQIRGLVEHPNVYASIGDIIDATEADAGGASDKDRLLAKWMTDNTQVQVGTDQEGNPEYLLLGGWIPAADLNDLWHPLKKLKNDISPILKLPAELALNKDAFLGEDIENFPGEREKFLGLPLYKRWMIKPLRNIRLLVEVDRLLATAQATGAFGETQLTNRRGDGIVPTIIRTLFGAKLQTSNLASRRRQRLRALRQVRQEQRLDRLRRQGINEDVLAELAKNPELLENAF